MSEAVKLCACACGRALTDIQRRRGTIYASIKCARVVTAFGGRGLTRKSDGLYPHRRPAW